MNNDRSSRFESWKRGLEDIGALIANDGRLPEGMKVWTPYGDMDCGGDIPVTYRDPAWAWYQGRILGQCDTHWWFVFLGYENLPFICQRHISELRPVITTELRPVLTQNTIQDSPQNKAVDRS
ncbi:hypothetical protein [Kribbella sp. NPDC049584]|uniref:hypothetical protein n=1 Tax=Kribbella sp. NPDC049584 TaxID=3154833 RepID=UPI00343BC82B